MAAPLTGKLVTVFGGSGFLGRHLVQALARRGWRIRVAVRRPDLAGHVQPLGSVGQIMPVQANVRVRWSVERAIEGADAVVNLVAILAESGRQRFAAVNAGGARAVAEATKAAGIERLVHVSAIGADPMSPSDYARTKAEGEAAVLEAVAGALIMRPSILFGPEDRFFNRFAGIARISPVLPIIGGETRFQPVFVGDVGEAIARAVEGEARPGTVYELGGPQVKTFRELMEMMLEIIGRRRAILDIPFGLARVQAAFLEWLPNAPLTVDQVRQLMRDNVVSAEAQAEKRTLEGLGIEPRTLASELPGYLWRFRRHGQYDAGPRV